MGYVETDLQFVNAIEAAAKRLVAVTDVDDGYVISTSSLYPSGASVQVRATFDGHTCFVSDMGLAYHEAEMLGATQRQFRRSAKAVADDLGVGFDDHSFFIVQVPIDRLSGAIKIVGAATHKAALMIEAGMTEQAERNDRELLIDRLVQVFGRQKVEKGVTVLGESGHSWTVTGRVNLLGGMLFDTATPAISSIVSAHTKFRDIQLVHGGAKGGVIALASPTKFAADYMSILKQSAEVIGIDDPEDTYRRMLEAA